MIWESEEIASRLEAESPWPHDKRGPKTVAGLERSAAANTRQHRRERMARLEAGMRAYWLTHGNGCVARRRAIEARLRTEGDV